MKIWEVRYIRKKDNEASAITLEKFLNLRSKDGWKIFTILEERIDDDNKLVVTVIAFKEISKGAKKMPKHPLKTSHKSSHKKKKSKKISAKKPKMSRKKLK